MTDAPRPEAPERIWTGVAVVCKLTPCSAVPSLLIQVSDKEVMGWQAYIRADALRPAAGEGEGWQLVPIIPTKEIREAFPAHIVDDCQGFDAAWHRALSAAPKSTQSPSLALAEENRVLREALKLARTYVHDVWEPGRVNVSAHLAQIDAALSTPSPHPHSQREDRPLVDVIADIARHEALLGLLAAVKAAKDFIISLDGGEDADGNTLYIDDLVDTIDASVAKAEACK